MVDLWFRGQRAADHGLYVDAVGAPILAKSRREAVELAGRSGFVLSADDTAAPILYPVVFFLPERDAARLTQAYAWLSGGVGELVLPTDPGHVLRAAVINEVAPVTAVGGQELQVTFVCQPYRYIIPLGSTITPSSGDALINPGTAPALPRIAFSATGEGSLTVGDAAVYVPAESAGDIVIDSDEETVRFADGTEAPLVSLMDDMFPVLGTGATAITWTGGVSGVTVTPGWRDR